MGVGRLEGGRQRCVEIIKPVDLWPFHEFARYLLGSSVVPLVFSSVSDIRRIRRLKPISLSPSLPPSLSLHPWKFRVQRSAFNDPQFSISIPWSLSLWTPSVPLSLSLFSDPSAPFFRLRSHLRLLLFFALLLLLLRLLSCLYLPTSLFRLLYCLEPLHRGCIPFPGLIET